MHCLANPGLEVLVLEHHCTNTQWALDRDSSCHANPHASNHTCAHTVHVPQQTKICGHQSCKLRPAWRRHQTRRSSHHQTKHHRSVGGMQAMKAHQRECMAAAATIPSRSLPSPTAQAHSCVQAPLWPHVRCCCVAKHCCRYFIPSSNIATAVWLGSHPHHPRSQPAQKREQERERVMWPEPAPPDATAYK